MFSRAKLSFFFLILLLAKASSETEDIEKRGFISVVEDDLESKVRDCLDSLTIWLEDFNERHIGNKELERVLHYERTKPKSVLERGRGKEPPTFIEEPNIPYHDVPPEPNVYCYSYPEWHEVYPPYFDNLPTKYKNPTHGSDVDTEASINTSYNYNVTAGFGGDNNRAMKNNLL